MGGDHLFHNTYISHRNTHIDRNTGKIHIATKFISYPFMFQKNSLLNSKKNFQRSYLHNGTIFEVETLPLFFNGPNVCSVKIP